MNQRTKSIDRQTVEIASPAKVNLSLRILGERADGYHDLVSLMTQVSCFDQLTFRKNRSSKIELRCPNHPELANDDNLVMRAARKIAPAGCGIEIELTKGIPVGAGLGGGSSDAAATLLALNELLALKLTDAALHELGSSLGADVPFFLLSQPAAIATGTGTTLTPLSGMCRLNLVLVYPGFAVSTVWAYQAYRQQKLSVNLLTLSGSNDKNFRRSLVDVSGLKTLQGVTNQLINDLEPVVIAKHRPIDDCKQMLRKCGAMGVLMSGSGSAVFGLFIDAKAATQAAAEVQAESGFWSMAVSSLA